MRVKLDEYDKVTALISGLYQFGENELFSQAALAVTDEEFFLYDDHRPTDKNNGVYHYVIKKRFNVNRYDFVVDEKLKGDADLSNYGRLFFYSEDEDQCFEFYYMVNDRKEVNKFLKELKNLGLATSNKTTKVKATRF